MEKVAISTIWEEDETISQEETEQITAVQSIGFNSKVVDLYNRTEVSKEVTCEVGNLKMPKPLAQAVQIMKRQHPECSMNSIINIVLLQNLSKS